MMEILITQLYAGCGIISLCGYMPQIKKLHKGEKSPDDISVKSWTIWNLSAFVALLYGLFCLHDFLFCMLNTVHVVMMSYLIFLIIYKRYVSTGHCGNIFEATFKYYLCRPFFGMAAYMEKKKIV